MTMESMPVLTGSSYGTFTPATNAWLHGNMMNPIWETGDPNRYFDMKRRAEVWEGNSLVLILMGLGLITFMIRR